MNHKVFRLSSEQAQAIICNIFKIAVGIQITPERLDDLLLDADSEEVEAFFKHVSKAQEDELSAAAQRPLVHFVGEYHMAGRY